jgi:hypothetical protein
MLYGSQNELYDTIGHEENGCLAYQLADQGAGTNVEEIVCACIGACAPSRERVPVKKTESTANRVSVRRTLSVGCLERQNAPRTKLIASLQQSIQL